MCETKKLCTCDTVVDGQDYWELEFHYGYNPASDRLVETRPEHAQLASEAATPERTILGPVTKPLFGALYSGIADRSQIEKIVKEEIYWLNSGDAFDFDYIPFEGDRLTFYVGRHCWRFSFKEGSWYYHRFG